MTKNIGLKSGGLLQLALVLGLALGTGACSTLSDLDPTGLISDDSAPATADSSTGAGDAAPTASADTAAGTTPDLASLPARPATSTAGQQQATTQSLAADGAQARYSADALRAGTEPAAPPPSADSVPPSAQMAQMAAASDAPPSAEPVPPTAAAPMAAPSAAAAPAAPARPSVAAAPPLAPVRTASLPPGAEPAVPANTPIRGMATRNIAMSDAALGFQPSAAPPLSPSINQWVAAPIVARYRQTAAQSGAVGTAMPAVASARGMGGPDMSGAVVANLDALSGPAGTVAAVNDGVTPSAVVFFPGDGVTLSAAARAQIRSAVSQYKSGGTIRVVGHASSRTADMPVEKHLETIFNKSQARANAVAQELIHEGVPADKVLVEAVGDSQPIYYESMPKGEDGNRRAEIFLQG